MTGDNSRAITCYGIIWHLCQGRRLCLTATTGADYLLLELPPRDAEAGQPLSLDFNGHSVKNSGKILVSVPYLFFSKCKTKPQISTTVSSSQTKGTISISFPMHIENVVEKVALACENALAYSSLLLIKCFSIILENPSKSYI